MLPQYDITTLLRIRALAEAGAQRVLPLLPSTHFLDSTPSATQGSGLTLPIPEPLITQLLAVGLDEASAERISSLWSETIVRLKGSTEDIFKRRSRSYNSLAPSTHGSKSSTPLVTLFTGSYFKTIQDLSTYILKDFAPRVIRARRFVGVDSPQRKSFNSSAVPLLERFFNSNAFPSRLEKCELAHRCDMTYEQIHHWFQNRRNRSKKAGNLLKKPSKNPLLHQLEESMMDALFPTSRGVDKLNDADLHIFAFDIDAPPHAYPTPYPPQCQDDPFPILPEHRSLQTPWVRVSSSHSPVSHSVVMDISDLTDAFSRLSLDSPSEMRRHLRVRPSRRAECRTYLHHISFATSCPRAPLPALIPRSRRSSRTSHSASCRPLLIPRASDHSGLGKPQSPDLDHPLSNTTTPVRNKRSLPRRIPKHRPIHKPVADAFTSTSSGTRHSSSQSSPSTTGIDSPLSTPTLPQSRPTWLVTPLPFHEFGTALPCKLKVDSEDYVDGKFDLDQWCLQTCHLTTPVVEIVPPYYAPLLVSH